MKLITKNTDYAVRALAYLALRGGEFTPSDEIARRERIPAYFLRRVINSLIKEGVLESKEGKKGGVRLAARPSEVRVIDLIKIFQGGVRLTECVVRKGICPNRGRCLLRKKVLKAEARLAKEIGRIKLSDLIKK